MNNKWIFKRFLTTFGTYFNLRLFSKNGLIIALSIFLTSPAVATDDHLTRALKTLGLSYDGTFDEVSKKYNENKIKLNKAYHTLSKHLPENRTLKEAYEQLFTRYSYDENRAKNIGDSYEALQKLFPETDTLKQISEKIASYLEAENNNIKRMDVGNVQEISEELRYQHQGNEAELKIIRKAVLTLTNPFLLFNVPTDASESEIKVSYRRLAMKYHPDRGGNKAVTQLIANTKIFFDSVFEAQIIIKNYRPNDPSFSEKQFEQAHRTIADFERYKLEVDRPDYSQNREAGGTSGAGGTWGGTFDFDGMWRTSSDSAFRDAIPEDVKNASVEQGKVAVYSVEGKISFEAERPFSRTKTTTLEGKFWHFIDGQRIVPVIFESNKGMLFLISQDNRVFQLGGEITPTLFQKFKQYVQRKFKRIPSGSVVQYSGTSITQNKYSSTEIVDFTKIFEQIKTPMGTLLSMEVFDGVSAQKEASRLSQANMRLTGPKQQQSNFEKFRQMLRNKPGQFFQTAQERLQPKLSALNFFNSQSTTNTQSQERALEIFSPEKLSKLSHAEIIALWRSLQHMDHSSTWWKTTKRFPMEVVAFYASLGAIMWMAHYGDEASNGEGTDFSPGNTVMDTFMSPLGLFSFYCFIYASSVFVGKSSLMLINLISKPYNVHAEKLRNLRINTNISRSAFQPKLDKLNTHYKISKGLISIPRFMMMPLGLAGGMILSTLVVDFLTDPNIKACDEGEDNPNEYRRYDYIRSCETAYNTWTVSNKMSTVGPDIIGLIAAAVIANKMITPGAKYLWEKGSSPKTRNWIGDKKNNLVNSKIGHWVGDKKSNLVKSKVGKWIGKGISKITMPTKFVLGALASIGTFIPFLAMHHLINDLYIIPAQKSNLIEATHDQAKEILSDAQSMDNWEQFSTEDCILKEDPRSISIAKRKQNERKGLEQNFWKQPFHFIESWWRGENFNCQERQLLQSIETYSNNWNEWRTYALHKFQTANRSWMTNNLEAYDNYSMVKDSILKFSTHPYEKEEMEPESIGPNQAYPFFGINLNNFIKKEPKNLNEFIKQLDTKENNSVEIRKINPRFEDIQPRLQQALDYIEKQNITPSRSYSYDELVSSHPDGYLNKNQKEYLDYTLGVLKYFKNDHISFENALEVLQYLWTCPPANVKTCVKKTAAGIEFLTSTLKRIDRMNPRNRHGLPSYRNLKTDLLNIRNILVCGTEESCSYSHFLKAYSKGMLWVELQNIKYKEIIEYQRSLRMSSFTDQFFDGYSDSPMEYLIQQMACGVDISTYEPPQKTYESLVKLQQAPREEFINQLPLYEGSSSAELGGDRFLIPQVTKEKASDKICDDSPKTIFHKTIHAHGKVYNSLLEYVALNIMEPHHLINFWIEKVEPQHIIHSQLLNRDYKTIVKKHYIPSFTTNDRTYRVNLSAADRAILCGTPEDSELHEMLCQITEGAAEETLNSVKNISQIAIPSSLMQTFFQNTGVDGEDHQSLPDGVLRSFEEQTSMLFNIIKSIPQKDSETIKIYSKMDRSDVESDESRLDIRGLCQANRHRDYKFLGSGFEKICKENHVTIIVTPQQVIDLAQELAFLLINDFRKYNEENLRELSAEIQTQLTTTQDRNVILQKQVNKAQAIDLFNRRFLDIIALLQHLINNYDMEDMDWTKLKEREDGVLAINETTSGIRNDENQDNDSQFIKNFLNFTHFHVEEAKLVAHDISDANILLEKFSSHKNSSDDIKQFNHLFKNAYQVASTHQVTMGDIFDEYFFSHPKQNIKTVKDLTEISELTETREIQEIKNLLSQNPSSDKEVFSIISQINDSETIRKWIRYIIIPINSIIIEQKLVNTIPAYINAGCANLNLLQPQNIGFNQCNQTIFKIKDQLMISNLHSLYSLFKNLKELTQQIELFSVVLHREQVAM